MAEDLTVQLLSMQSAGTRQLAQIAVLRKSFEMEASIVGMIDDANRNAPAPAGTGLVVDKRA
jgi:hypothetical protein